MPAGDRVRVKAGKPLALTLKVYPFGRPVSMSVSIFHFSGLPHCLIHVSFLRGEFLRVSLYFLFPC